MKIQSANFIVPYYPESEEMDEYNRFLRGHKVIKINKVFGGRSGVNAWLISVDYLEMTGAKGKDAVDYKEVLSEEDFKVYSGLREVRKKLADEAGMPVYSVCTNSQLSEIVKTKPRSLADLKLISGIGEARADKFGSALIAALPPANETPEPAI